MPSPKPTLAADERLYEPVDDYIPTPDAHGNCEPHIKAAGEGWYWVVCEDCSVDLVEGEAKATAQLADCDGESES